VRVRAWYGLPGEIVVEEGGWHLVSIAGIPLPHPPLVNRFIRRGLSRSERLRYSYLHEFGHLQTLPLALLHAGGLALLERRRRSRGGAGRRARVVALVGAHEALWELASEAYVAVQAGAEYRGAYRRNPFRWRLPVFWSVMGALAVGGTVVLLRGRRAGV